jgi:DNA-binding MarR family transcriptional regulator
MLIAERRLVGEHLGFAICPCPAWDVLLDLYIAHQEQRLIYLGSLCVAANVPASSAHRKISDMMRRGLLDRSADEGDGRRVTVSLAPDAYRMMDRLLDRISARMTRKV